MKNDNVKFAESEGEEDAHEANSWDVDVPGMGDKWHDKRLTWCLQNMSDAEVSAYFAAFNKHRIVDGAK